MSGSLAAQTRTGEPQDSSTTIVQDVKDYSKEDTFFSRLLKSVLVEDDEEQLGITRLKADRKLARSLS